MTVDEFITTLTKLNAEEDNLVKKMSEIVDTRNDLRAALNNESKTVLWKQLKGKALKGPKGDVWAFKGLKVEESEYVAEFTRTHPNEMTIDTERKLSYMLSWIAFGDYEMIDVSPSCPVIERYISERRKIGDKFKELYKEEQALHDQAASLADSLETADKSELLRFLQTYKIVLDKGTYTFKSLRMEKYNGRKQWWVTCKYEQQNSEPSVSTFSLELYSYLNNCLHPGAHLEPV